MPKGRYMKKEKEQNSKSGKKAVVITKKNTKKNKSKSNK